MDKMVLQRNVLITLFFTFCIFSAVLYEACNKPPCTGVICDNGGACGNGICTCVTGYYGKRCDTLIINNFTGAWTGVDACSNANYPDTLYISAMGNLQAYVTDTGRFGSSGVFLSERK